MLYPYGKIMTQQNNHHGGPPDDRDDFEKALGKVTEGLSAVFNGLAGQKRRKITPEAEAFFKAVRTNDVQAIADAVNNGFNPDDLNAHGETGLMMAARMNLPRSAAALLSGGAGPKKRSGAFNRLPIEEAVHYGSAGAVEILARGGGYVAGPLFEGKSLLRLAVEKNMGDVVRALLKAGADSNELTENGTTPLIIALTLEKPDAVAALLEFQDVTHGLNTWRAKSDERKRSAFQLAVEYCDADAVGKMTTQGAFVNAPDAEGMTPLLNAIARGDMALVRTLAQAGADLNRADAPLVFACKTPLLESRRLRARIVSLLVELGADPDQVEPGTGLTPVYAAAANVSGEEALRVLVANGANPDIRLDKHGTTPLIKAVILDSKQAVERLLAAGADARLKDGEGKTALDHASEDRDPSIAQMLKDALHKARTPPGPQP
jgi:ankyrin repeat protein